MESRLEKSRADRAEPAVGRKRRSDPLGKATPRIGQKSQQRWASILQVATELFKKRGFYATSMQDISDAVGIRKASLYYYVTAKEELLFEILKGLHKGGEALIDGVNHNSPDPLGELRFLLTQMGIYAGKHADRLRIFTNDFDYLNPEQKSMIISDRRLYRVAVKRLIAASVARGQIADTMDVSAATHAALGTASAVSDWYREGGNRSIEEIAVQNAAMIVQGLRYYDRG